jgi:hypothetical protein
MNALSKIEINFHGKSNTSIIFHKRANFLRPKSKRDCEINRKKAIRIIRNVALVLSSPVREGKEHSRTRKGEKLVDCSREREREREKVVNAGIRHTPCDNLTIILEIWVF